MILNAVTIHIRDVREGKLVEPIEKDHEELETYEHLMTTDTCDDLVVPTKPTVSMLH